jgi:16S rRNA (cytidine1402-2'-O)-methyltransferase
MAAPETSAALFVVATPIGNLDDMTPRAMKILESADIIAAEDTRHTRQLLGHLGIRQKQVVAYHDHNEQEQSVRLIERVVAEGLTLALVSDAGTPCISDPGYRLVREAHRQGVRVHPVPGPSALTALVSASGLPTDRFMFVGFPAVKSKELRAQVEQWRDYGCPVVFYESLRRLQKTVEVIAAVAPDAEIAIGRELTKLYEEVACMPVSEALAWIQAHDVLKGEATIMVSFGAGKTSGRDSKFVTPDQLITLATEDFRKGSSLKDLLKSYADAGYKRAELYQLLLKAKDLV